MEVALGPIVWGVRGCKVSLVFAVIVVIVLALLVSTLIALVAAAMLGAVWAALSAPYAALRSMARRLSVPPIAPPNVTESRALVVPEPGAVPVVSARLADSKSGSVRALLPGLVIAGVALLLDSRYFAEPHRRSPAG